MDFKKQTYAIQVSQFIRKMIQEGELKPGDPVKENDLASFLNISRAPIREALQILTQDGLIVSEPQKGKTIRVLSPKEIADGYTLTAILESEGILMSLSEWTEEDNKDLLNVLRKMEKKSKEAVDITELSELDELLHNMLLSHCTNDQLVENARRFSSNISKYLCREYWKKTFDPQCFYARHKLIVDTFFTKDSEKIKKVILAHYYEIAVAMSKLIEEK
jgi:DNA-binding GntR family transcriptional regulator